MSCSFALGWCSPCNLAQSCHSLLHQLHFTADCSMEHACTATAAICPAAPGPGTLGTLTVTCFEAEYTYSYPCRRDTWDTVVPISAICTAIRFQKKVEITCGLHTCQAKADELADQLSRMSKPVDLAENFSMPLAFKVPAHAYALPVALYTAPCIVRTIRDQSAASCHNLVPCCASTHFLSCLCEFWVPFVYPHQQHAQCTAVVSMTIMVHVAHMHP